MLLVLLALSAFLPWTRFELNTASDAAVVETAATLISAVAATLFFGRFWSHLRLRDLLLAVGLAVIGVSNLGADLLLAGNLVVVGHSAAWLVIGGRLVGWLSIAGSAVVRDRRLPRPAPPILQRLAAAAGVLVAAVVLVLALGAHVTSYEVLHREALGDPTAMLLAQVLLALLTTIAAVAFRREAAHAGSPPARLLALACAFAAAAALAGCAQPTFYASHVGMSDILRLGWLVALFACVCIEWSLDERRAQDDALARERRRMAADVHDLIMQDLSFALANARALVDDPAHGGEAHSVVSAGERALAGARDVVNALTEQRAEPIVAAVEASVRTAARRTPLKFEATGTLAAARADEPTRDALVHIGREAVTNAVKHAGAGAIEVVLERDDEWRLTVRDDGQGLHPPQSGRRQQRNSAAVGGFGLRSMRQHAEALGGTLSLRTGEHGTIVEASLP
jgi:signal transduction histidine kinase